MYFGIIIAYSETNLKTIAYFTILAHLSMKRLAPFLLLSSVFLLLMACSPSKSYTKKANKLAEAGLHDEASFAYIQALGHDRANIDARVGLRLSGQQALNGYLDRFFRAHTAQSYKESVYAYRQAEAFYGDVTALNMELEFPKYYAQYYEEDLERYLSELYQKGSNHLAEKRFKDAEVVFREINSLKINYRDVGDLKQMSIIIPAYDAGTRAFEAGQYRKAYDHFDKVFALNTAYRDVNELRRVSKERATLTIAVMPFENSLSYTYTTNLTSFIVSDLAKANNDFIVLIDREHTQKVIEEQKFNLAFGSNGGAALQAGELMGAKLILTGRVLDLGIRNPDMSHKEKTGYESYTERVYNAAKKRTQNVTRYRKVMYSEFTGSSSVRMKVQYQLISAESGAILLSDVFEYSEVDEVNYISYEGNASNLFAGVWRSRTQAHSADRVYNSFSQKREVDQKMEGKRDFRAMNDMLADLQGRISETMAGQVLNYERQRAQ